jgi:hypothetical protein
MADASDDTDYIFKASLNGSREKLKEHSSRMMKKNVLFNEDVTPAHIRSVLPSVLEESSTQIETEVHNITKSLPRLKPFDLSIRLDHSLDPGSWRTHLSRIGFDVTIIHATSY